MRSKAPTWLDGVNPPVFLVSAAVAVVFVLFGVAFTDRAAALADLALGFITTTFGWLYVLAVGFLLLFCLWLMVSRHGQIRLGRDDEEPAFSTPTWFAMLFSAGMGIGLVFYGVAEPMIHYASPPFGEPHTVSAAKGAMALTFFHWGLHAWAIYVVMGVSLAYFAFRRGEPLTIRSAFRPLLGDRVDGPVGHAIDILAVFGTLFGLATSLGLGSMQVNAGLSHLFGIERSTVTQVILIALITGAATVSVVSGLDKGVRRLSEINVTLASGLLLFVFVAGPTLFLLRLYADSIGNYLQKIVQTTFWAAPFDGLDWQSRWTLFYWGWWIAWSPFVGTFIARVSRGRTIRELVAGVLLMPTALTFFWLSVFGGTALHLERGGDAGIAAAVEQNVDTAIFELLARLPLGSVTATVAMIVVILFFVTSSDSGSLVVDMITSGGHPDPPTWQRVFWAVAEGVIAAVLLLAGGLAALQSAAIATGLPFCLVLLAMCWSLVRALRSEERARRAVAVAVAVASECPESDAR